MKFIEQGHVRVGPDTVTDPAYLVTRYVRSSSAIPTRADHATACQAYGGLRNMGRPVQAQAYNHEVQRRGLLPLLPPRESIYSLRPPARRLRLVVTSAICLLGVPCFVERHSPPGYIVRGHYPHFRAEHEGPLRIPG